MSLKFKWRTGAGASGHEVWRNTTASTTGATKLADVTGNTYEDTTAAEGVSYWYAIKATGPGGTSGFSALLGPLVGPKVLASPTGVVATITTFTTVQKIVVTWGAVSGATKYDVWRHTSDNFAGATKVGSNVTGTSYDDTSVGIDTLYVYWVVAKDNSSHESLPSLAAGGFASPIIPAYPSGLTATDDEEGFIDLAWSFSVAAFFNVYRSTDPDFTDEVLIASVTSGLSYRDEGIESGVTYYYRLRAGNAYVLTAFSASATGYSPSGAGGTAPDAPSGCVATDDQIGGVTITCDPVPTAESYSVWRYPTNTPGSATQIASGLASPSYVDTTMALSTEYYYWFKATNAAGTSGFSNGDNGFALPGVPLPPANVAATSGLVGLTTITFDASAGAASYSVWRQLGAGAAVELVSGLTALTYNDTTGESGIDYTYTVRATNTTGTSSPSAGDVGMRYVSVCAVGTITGGSSGLDRSFYCPVGTSFTIGFDAQSVKDRLRVYDDGVLVIDTGCISGSVIYPGVGYAGVLRFEVTPNCDGGVGTGWDLTLTC